MAMTLKHYQETAQIIKDERESWDLPSVDEGMRSAVMAATLIMATKLANMFALDNPRFDRGQFYRACGFDE